MVINHLLTGMTLQVRTNILECPRNWAGTHFRKLAIEPNHRVAGAVALSFREGHLVKPLTLLSSILWCFSSSKKMVCLEGIQQLQTSIFSKSDKLVIWWLKGPKRWKGFGFRISDTPKRNKAKPPITSNNPNHQWTNSWNNRNQQKPPGFSKLSRHPKVGEKLSAVPPPEMTIQCLLAINFFAQGFTLLTRKTTTRQTDTRCLIPFHLPLLRFGMKRIDTWTID